MFLLVVKEQKMAVVKLVVQQFDLDQVVQMEVETHQIVFHQGMHGSNSPLGMVLDINKLADYMDTDVNN
jgi:hypothetical protein